MMSGIFQKPEALFQTHPAVRDATERERQAALSVSEREQKIEADRLAAIQQFKPQFGFDQRRRGLTSLLGSG
jgi:hypothetical protein